MLGWQGLHARENAYSKDEKLHPWIFSCPQDQCYYTVCGASEGEASVRGKQHICPYIGGKTHFGGTVTNTLLETCWEMADHEYDKLTSIDPELSGNRLEQQRGVLKGVAMLLAVWSTPHYRTVQAVAEELRKRKSFRDAGQPYESAGLGSRRYETVTEFAARSTKAADPVARAEKVLSDSDRTAIKFAHESMPQQFTFEYLAQQYAVSVAVVTAVCSAAGVK